MSTQVYNLIEVALKYSLWPILCILGICLFRKQLSLILSNIGSARKVKVDSSGFSLETGKDEVKDKTSDESSTTPDTLQLASIEESNEKKINGWFDKVYSLFEEGKSTEAELYFNEYINNIPEPSKFHEDYPFFLYVKYKFTPNESIPKELLTFIERTNEYEQNRMYIASYCNCLEDTSQYDKAIKFITELLNKYNNNIKAKTSLTVRLSRNYLKNFQIKESEDVIIKILDELKNCDESELEQYFQNAYEQLAEIEKTNKNTYNYVLCLDKAAEYMPTEKEALFSSAYQASQTVLNPIEIANYDKLLTIDSKYGMAQNNMGATASKFNLKLISGDYYSKAEDLNITIAMANIGTLLQNAGLYHLAETIAYKALKIGEPHENIHHLLSRIKTEKDDEFRKWDELRKSAFELQKNLRIYTDFYYTQKKITLDTENWLDNYNQKVNLSLSNSELLLNWNDEEIDIRFEGKVKNLTFKGYYTCIQKKSSTLLGSTFEKLNIYCLGYYSESEQAIIIFSESVTDKRIIRLKKDEMPNRIVV